MASREPGRSLRLGEGGGESRPYYRGSSVWREACRPRRRASEGADACALDLKGIGCSRDCLGGRTERVPTASCEGGPPPRVCARHCVRAGESAYRTPRRARAAHHRVCARVVRAGTHAHSRGPTIHPCHPPGMLCAESAVMCNITPYYRSCSVPSGGAVRERGRPDIAYQIAIPAG